MLNILQLLLFIIQNPLKYFHSWSFYFRPNDPRDKRLPKDIKLASLRLAASRHSSVRTKSPHHPQQRPPSATGYQRSTLVPNSSTPMPAARPISSVSHHTGHLIPHHPEITMRRMEQRLDNLQTQLEKALQGINQRMDAILGALKTSHESVGEKGRTLSLLSSASKRPGNRLLSSQKSQSDCENDVFLEEGTVLVRSASASPNPSVGTSEKPVFSRAPV